MRATIVLILLSLTLALAACEEDNGDDADPTIEPTAVGSPTPGEAAFTLPDSPISAPLDQPYATAADGSQLTPDQANYPFPAGSVTAVWYQSDGMYVVHFDGFPVDEALCPGTSIAVDQQFQDAANSPAQEGACEGVTTVQARPTGAYICGDGQLLFLTAVSTDLEGDLFASTNRQAEDGSSTGLLGFVTADLARTPEVDISPCTATD